MQSASSYGTVQDAMLLSSRRGVATASPRYGYVMNDWRDTSGPGLPVLPGTPRPMLLRLACGQVTSVDLESMDAAQVAATLLAAQACYRAP